jgi:hypothetical protein
VTAEAVIMNKSAVAMAADSAVTISGGRRGVKTYDTVNKLFELVKGAPVGVMIYANAELAGMPWETIIKCYRQDRQGLTLDRLEAYAEDFANFVNSPESIVGREHEEFSVVAHAFSTLVLVFEGVEREIENCFTATGKLVKARLKTVLDNAIESAEQSIGKIDEAPWASSLPPARLRRVYGAAVESLVDEMFSEFALSPSQRKKLANIALESNRRLQAGVSPSGLVVSGFGEKDYFPKLMATTVYGKALGVLQIEPFELKEVSLVESGVIETFAQDEMAWNFLLGINFEVRNTIMSFWSDWVTEIKESIKEAVSSKISNIPEEQLAEVATIARQITHDKFHEFLDRMNDRQLNLYIQPILQSVGLLPKDELGVLAESLVNLTSLKQRMSIHDAQTVGGAIDVALISKGDGFVWLKRKHYFSRDLNPAWHLTHHGKVVSMGD